MSMVGGQYVLGDPDVTCQIKEMLMSHVFVTMEYQCSKLRFYFVHTPGAHEAKIVHVCSPLYKGINILEYACTHRVHRFENMCTRQPKCAHRSQGAPLISNTGIIRMFLVDLRSANVTWPFDF